MMDTQLRSFMQVVAFTDGGFTQLSSNITIWCTLPVGLQLQHHRTHTLTNETLLFSGKAHLDDLSLLQRKVRGVDI
jgi:hypothetical protein